MRRLRTSSRHRQPSVVVVVDMLLTIITRFVMYRSIPLVVFTVSMTRMMLLLLLLRWQWGYRML